jgi:excinuclease ABC subunit B
MVDPLSGELLAEDHHIFIYPAVHYMMPEEQLQPAIASIREELRQRYDELRGEGKLLEAQRLMARTKYDLEMMQEIGYCSGVENYSRHLDGRAPGSMPSTLMDYFPDDYLLMIDESHVTLPQMRAMYHSDRSRKRVLVDHGFRLPSAMDNRPLQFEEIEKVWPQVVFVSATPGPYELEKCQGAVVEQVIRPTGLLDPVIELRPAANQVPDLLKLAAERSFKKQRTLVTTLTKRLAEDLAAYLLEQGLACRYLHSDIETLDRVQILRELRQGDYDVLVGVNLLREGLDLPEVSLVAIMDADKAGFLRSATSLIQQIGRAARHVDATVVLYADKVTPAMQQALDETNRRRKKQQAYNEVHNITPTTVKKEIRRGIEMELRARKTAREAIGKNEGEFDREELSSELEKQMHEAAEALEFEKAAQLRDKIKQLSRTPMIGPADEHIASTRKPKPGTPGIRPPRRGKKKSNR